jgi:trk system potassium uptake protein TrkA
MNIVIMGCGRVGAQLASILDNEGNTITVLDNNKLSFRRLPPNFNGTALLGDGTDQDILKKALMPSSQLPKVITAMLWQPK